MRMKKISSICSRHLICLFFVAALLLLTLRVSTPIYADDSSTGETTQQPGEETPNEPVPVNWTESDITEELSNIGAEALALVTNGEITKDEFSDKVTELCLASSLPDSAKLQHCSPTQRNNAMLNAIISLDTEKQVDEITKNYYKFFNNSSVTATYTDFDIWDWGSSILIAGGTGVSWILEQIGLIVSFLCLMFINLSTTSFIPDVIREGADWINNLVLGNPAIAIPLISLIGVVGVVKALRNLQNVRTLRVLMDIVFKSILTFLFVLFLAIPGRNILYKIDDVMMESVDEYSTLLFAQKDIDGNPIVTEQETLANNIKSEVFYMLQEQPFMLRHFGQMSVEEIATSFNITVEEAQLRYTRLAQAPTRANAKAEYKAGNQNIANDILSTGMLIFSSVFAGVHRTLLSVVFMFISVVIALLKSVKEILIGITFIDLFQYAIKENHDSVKSFFNRFSWIVALGFVPIMFVLSLMLISRTISSVASIHYSLVLLLDIIMILLGLIAWKNKSKIMETLSKIKEPITGIMEGTYSLADFGNNAMNSISGDKRQSNEFMDSSPQSMGDSSSSSDAVSDGSKESTGEASDLADSNFDSELSEESYTEPTAETEIDLSDNLEQEENEEIDPNEMGDDSLENENGDPLSEEETEIGANFITLDDPEEEKVIEEAHEDDVEDIPEVEETVDLSSEEDSKYNDDSQDISLDSIETELPKETDSEQEEINALDNQSEELSSQEDSMFDDTGITRSDIDAINNSMTDTNSLGESEEDTDSEESPVQEDSLPERVDEDTIMFEIPDDDEQSEQDENVVNANLNEENDLS